jgi:hypothetical protein
MDLPMRNHVRFEISFDTAYDLTPTWNEFQPREASWGFRRSGGPTGACEPGRARFVVDNRNGQWDPATGLGGSPWAGAIRKWLQVRVIASDDGFATAGTSLFHGFLVDVKPMDGRFDGHALVEATDALGILAAHRLDEDLTRSAELAGVRADAILDAAGIPAGWQGTVQNGIVALVAATVSGQALAAVQECARAEGGHLWCSRDGAVNFTDRHYFYDSFTRTDFPLDDTLIRQALIPKTLGALGRVAEGASSGATGAVKKFGTPDSGFPASTRRALGTSAVWDADSASTAEWLQRHENFSGSRVDSVELDVRTATGSAVDAVVRDALVAGDLKWLDTVEVDYTPIHGDTVNQVCWVEAEEHRVTKATWECTLGLSPYATDYANTAANFIEWGDVMAAGKIPGV